MYKKNVKAALDALRNTLVGLGANPYRIDLPRPPGVLKVGADDFIVSAGRRAQKAFQDLERIPLFLADGITGVALLGKKFEDKTWVIQDLIPIGLSICAGKPKIGKSWLVLTLAVALSGGKRALNHYQIEEAVEAVYLALEDSEARLQNRLKIIKASISEVKNLHFFCDWPTVENGGLVALEHWLEQNPKCRAVFIDTLAKVRKSVKKDNSYYDDYEAISELKKIADRFQVGIIVVHHLRKEKAEDPFDAISGTTGISGSADTNIVLMRDRNNVDAVLHITGRDIKEQSLALSFSEGVWEVIGEATKVYATKTQQEILFVLYQAKEPMTPTQIARETDRSVGGLSKTLRKMINDGHIVKVGNGAYIPKSKASKKYQRKG